MRAARLHRPVPRVLTGSDGKPLLISSGEQYTSGGPITEDVIPEEVKLSLKLDQGQNRKENIRVMISFIRPNPRRRSRDESISGFLLQAQGAKKKLQRFGIPALSGS